MNIRVWGTSLLMFLSTVTAVGQTANRYLKAPHLCGAFFVSSNFTVPLNKPNLELLSFHFIKT